MKKIAVLALCAACSAAASPPRGVLVTTTGSFDANFVYSGTYIAHGAIESNGTINDSPRFAGVSMHIMRTFRTSDNQTFVFDINANHVKGSKIVLDWCPPPSSIPADMVLAPEIGNWTANYGTGQYSTVHGTGRWAAWVVVDPLRGVPVSATECMDGKLSID